MIQSIVSAVHELLKGANTSRSFTVQTLLPGATNPSVSAGSKSRPFAGDIGKATNRRNRAGAGDEGEEEIEEQGEEESQKEEERQARTNRKKAAPNYKVRTDLTARTLDEMLGVGHPSQVGGWVETQSRATTGASGRDGEGRRGKRRALGENADDAVILDDTDDEAPEGGGGDGYGVVHDSEGGGRGRGKGMEIKESLCEFSSISDLRKSVKKKGNTGKLIDSTCGVKD
jgi:DNA mismatch repair protein MLH1